MLAKRFFSVALVPVVSFVIPNFSAEHVSEMFSCYTVNASVEQKYAIDEK